MTELDLLTNPNAVSPQQANVDELFQKIELEFNEFVLSTWEITAGLTRMKTWLGGFTYNDAFRPSDMNETWEIAYVRILPDVELLAEINQEKSAETHLGAAKIMKAYVLITLVDLFGHVPYSEALLGADKLSPNKDPDASIYAEAQKILKEAVVHLEKTDQFPIKQDLYYDNDREKWIALANSIQLKILVNTRLVNPNARIEIDELLTNGNLIDENSEDFQFKFNQNTFPDNRNPFYVKQYESEDRDREFLANYYIWLLKGDKKDEDDNVITDPRIRFYFYRQSEVQLGPDIINLLTCTWDVPPFIPNTPPSHYAEIDPDMPYCIMDNGYFGRDHMNGSGIPPNFQIRTVYGLYPMGGKFDDNSFNHVDNNIPIGAKGEGINPILLANYLDFMRAEVALTLGTSDNARDLLERGIRKSIEKVIGFKEIVRTDMDRMILDPISTPVSVEEHLVPSQNKIENYIDFVLNQYDQATSQEERLDIIMKEYHIALWGNGIEAYNNYRRTCMPANMQPTYEPWSGEFRRSLLYPANHVFQNENADPEESLANRPPFWDVNEDGCTR